MMMEMLEKSQNADHVHVPVGRGARPLTDGSIGGNPDIMDRHHPGLPATLFKGGQLKAPAVLSLQRAPALLNATGETEACRAWWVNCGGDMAAPGKGRGRARGADAQSRRRRAGDAGHGGLLRGTGRDRDEGRAGGARHHHEGRDRALGAGPPRFGNGKID
ncbi:MAG: hypothetical protein IPO58_04520 [Betaproteobacteria bacterium]|nr:hypothetical protein [Betaproteobacteria bacterium]